MEKKKSEPLFQITNWWRRRRRSAENNNFAARKGDKYEKSKINAVIGAGWWLWLRGILIGGLAAFIPQKEKKKWNRSKKNGNAIVNSWVVPFGLN